MANRDIFFNSPFIDSELIFGLVGAVGSNLGSISNVIKNHLSDFYTYDVDIIEVSEEILKSYSYLIENKKTNKGSKQYKRVNDFMTIGTTLRELTDDSFVALAIADHIQKKRQEANEDSPPEHLPRQAFIIKSLKNTREVEILRTIYGNGFYLIGIYEDEMSRSSNLQSRNISDSEIADLIKRDQEEDNDHGQQARDTFQLSDFFVDNTSDKKAKASIIRFIDLIFGDPFITPTFGEYAMFMAYSASLRSADLKRQIGAVICKNEEIIASGANDCPKYGGGLYWTFFNKDTDTYEDSKRGRDYVRGEDSNKIEFRKIAVDILEKFGLEMSDENIIKLRKTKLGDLTEYGRVVHAEMEAISMCARNNISCLGAELYATTFPCHVCAKHIVSSGIEKVVYIEAYPKSKAFDLFDDSISDKEADRLSRVLFIPFFGVGPRCYINLFAMNANPLPDKIRKDPKSLGKKFEWDKNKANVRSQMLYTSYLEREVEHSVYYRRFRSQLNCDKE